MNSTLAFAFCCGFIGWLFFTDTKHKRCSGAVWIPIIWAFILGSRPLSLWLAAGDDFHAVTYDDKLFDKLSYLGLIVGGLVVVVRRRANFGSILANNRAVCFLFAFWAVSAIWADSPIVAFKRWVKDLGNLVMVLVILSEENPVEVVKIVFARCSYLLIPISFLLIKWYPAMGSYYDRWLGKAFYQGVTTNKNQLGITLAVCILFLVWKCLQAADTRSEGDGKLNLLNSCALILMAFWMLKKANSATSLACAVLGTGGLLALRLSWVRKRRAYLVAYAVGSAVVLVLAFTVFDIGAMGANLLGRDASLHGRTDIWAKALAEKSDPLVGAGFYSFWSPARVAKFSEVYSFSLTQAHNGYLETYLNGGVLGLAFLAAVIIAGGRTVHKRLVADPEWGSISLIFWVIILAHNWSEASFNKLNLLWFVLLLVSLDYPRRRNVATAEVPLGTSVLSRAALKERQGTASSLTGGVKPVGTVPIY